MHKINTNKKEIATNIIRCSYCGAILQEIEGEKYLPCSKCKRFNVNKNYKADNKILKGGVDNSIQVDKMTEEKLAETLVDNNVVALTKENKVEKNKSTNLLDVSAQTTIDFMNKELKLSDSDKRKVCSRVYKIITKKIKSK